MKTAPKKIHIDASLPLYYDGFGYYVKVAANKAQK
jgi:hypothetical protein